MMRYVVDRSLKAVEMILSIVARKWIMSLRRTTEDKLIQWFSESRYLSLQMDTSTDIQSLCQVLVFVHYVGIWKNNLHKCI